MSTSADASPEAIASIRQLGEAEFHALLACALSPSIDPKLFTLVCKDCDWAKFSSFAYALGMATPSSDEGLTLLPSVTAFVISEAQARGINPRGVHHRIGVALEGLDLHREALRHYLAANDQPAVDRLLAAFSTTWALHGHVDDLLDAHRALETSGRGGRALTMLDAAWASIAAGSMARAKPQVGLARELLGSAASKETLHSLVLAEGFVAYELGSFTDALNCADRVLAAAERDADQALAALWLKAMSAFRLRNFQGVAAVLAEADRSGAPPDLASTMIRKTVRAMFHCLRTDPAPALEAADQALLALEAETPQRHFMPMDAWLIRIWSLRALGRDQEAVGALSAADQHLGPNDSPLARMEWLRMSAELALDRADIAHARNNLRRLRSLAEEAHLGPEGLLLADDLEAGLRLRLREFARAGALAARMAPGIRKDLITTQVLAQTRPDLAVSRIRSMSVQGWEGLVLDLIAADLNLKLGNRREAEAAVNRAFALAAVSGLVALVVHAPATLSPLLLKIAATRGDLFSERVTSRLIAKMESGGAAPGTEAVTERELSIMRLLATGLSVAKVAAHLEISIETVKSHARHVSKKLGVESRAEAIEHLRDRGLI